MRIAVVVGGPEAARPESRRRACEVVACLARRGHEARLVAGGLGALGLAVRHALPGGGRKSTDAVLALGGADAGRCALWLNAIRRTAVVVWVGEQDDPRFRPRLWGRIARARLWFVARRVLVASESSRERLLADYGAVDPLGAARLAPRVEVVGHEANAVAKAVEEAARPAPCVWLVGPAPWGRGGVAAVVRQIVTSPLTRRWRICTLPTHEVGPVLLRLVWAAWGLAQVALGLLVRRPDLVHLKIASRGSFYRKALVPDLCRLRGVPVIVHVHGGGFDRFVAGSPAPVRRLARRVLEKAPVVLVHSERWRERILRLFPGSRVEILPNPVETARYAELAEARASAGPQPRPGGLRRVLFLGDLVRRKGVFDLVRAWPEVLRSVPGARLVLAGTGNVELLRDEIRAAGLDGAVEMPGWVDHDGKRRLLAECDLFVLPSYVEGLPLSLLEAMAAGLPSVVTPVGGVPDAITDGVEALVVEPGDAEALARAVIRVLADADLARDLGRAARARAAAFDIGIYARELDRVYSAVLAECRREAASAGGAGGARA